MEEVLVANKKDNKKNKKGTPIKGNLKPFKGTSIEKRFETLKNYNVIPEDMLIELRNTLKEAVAMRHVYANKRAGKHEVISEASQALVFNYLQGMHNHPYAASFVNCIINTYNGLPAMLIKLNEPRCRTRDTYKANKHALKDCLKAADTYIKPIMKKMVDDSIDYDDELIGRFKDIRGSIAFFGNYILSLSCGELPKRISENTFNGAQKHDRRIAEHYILNSSTNEYIRINGNNKFSAINQECATYVICYKNR